MTMTAETTIQALTTDSIRWKHVQDLPCVHTFYKGYYNNLCLYNIKDGIRAISLNVDNVQKNENDIVDDSFTEDTQEFNTLYPIYREAMEKAEVIRSGSLV